MKLMKMVAVSFILLLSSNLMAQKHFSRSGKITFSSDALLEKIEAINQKATSVIDVATGKIEFAVLIKAFQFEKALMQEHFNENYMESDNYPKAIFKGMIAEASSIDFEKDGNYPVSVKGDLTIHGETKEVYAKGVLLVKDNKVSAKADFEVLVADYKIKIPNVVKDNIAKSVKINVDVDYELFKKKSAQLTAKN